MLSTSSEELVAAVEVARFTAPITVLKDKAHTAELEDGCVIAGHHLKLINEGGKGEKVCLQKVLEKATDVH